MNESGKVEEWETKRRRSNEKERERYKGVGTKGTRKGKEWK